jgi:hypothetical protein
LSIFIKRTSLKTRNHVGKRRCAVLYQMMDMVERFGLVRNHQCPFLQMSLTFESTPLRRSTLYILHTAQRSKKSLKIQRGNQKGAINRIRTDNTMAKNERTRGQTTIYNIYYSLGNTNPTKNHGLTQVLRKV